MKINDCGLNTYGYVSVMCNSFLSLCLAHTDKYKPHYSKIHRGHTHTLALNSYTFQTSLSFPPWRALSRRESSPGNTAALSKLSLPTGGGGPNMWSHQPRYWHLFLWLCHDLTELYCDCVYLELWPLLSTSDIGHRTRMPLLNYRPNNTSDPCHLLWINIILWVAS